MASNNMYRVGDFVYFETSAGAPYQIRKIEELNKTATGAVEAKVVCFYRRRDLSNSLLSTIDKKVNHDICESSDEEHHLLKHRELFITRQLETLPATHIRGKAHVTQFNENELLSTYTSSENTFFYNLIYDSIQKTLTSGKNIIQRGPDHQAYVPKYNPNNRYNEKDDIIRDQLKWNPNNKMDEESITNFITVCRSLGTYARACDLTSSIRQPNLAAAAAAASRDITLNEALNRLHEANYNFQEALLLLTPKGSPSIVRDEMEEWSASEGKLFEEGLGKYGKFFNYICNDFIPWKNPKKIVEFYYMWKTSQHYLQLKRIKRCENEHKLKQVYIPNYTKPNPAVLFTGSLSSTTNNTNTGCESCGSISSGQWFAWGPPNLHCKLCDSCWNYWKRYGGLKNPTRQDHQTLSSSPLPAYNALILNKSIATHLYQCPQIGCDKHFRQAGQLYSHMSAHPGLLESLDLLDQNNPSFYEEFKNQKNGFFLVTSNDFKLARRIFKSHLQSNFRMSRCFNKDNRRRLAFECMTKARLKSHFIEFIKSPKEELLHKKYLPRNFGSLDKVIEKKKRRVNHDTSNALLSLKNDVALPNSRKRPMPIFDDMEEKRIFLTSSLTIPKRHTISNEAVCMVPTFIATKFIKKCRLDTGNDFIKRLCRKPFFDHSLYNILSNH